MVEATGFEPTTFASRTQRATNCATPRFGFFRKWSNMWSNHSFRDFFIKLYWRNCQVFQGVQRFAKLANFYSVICSRTQRATNCATPRFGFFRKWSNMWSNHSFRDFFIKLYWQNCQVFQGVQRFAKLAKSYSVICSRTRRATSCATPRIITNVIIPNANTIVNSFLTPFLPFSKK